MLMSIAVGDARWGRWRRRTLSASFAGAGQYGVGLRAGEVRGPVAITTLVPRRRAAGPPPPPRSMVISGCASSARSVTRVGESRRGPPPARRPPAPGWRRPQRRMMEPQRRISACSRPTALYSAIVGAEGVGADQLRQTLGLVRGGGAHRAHLVQHHRHAGLGDLPGGFGAGEPAADHVNGFGHRRQSSASRRSPERRLCASDIAAGVKIVASPAKIGERGACKAWRSQAWRAPGGTA